MKLLTNFILDVLTVNVSCIVSTVSTSPQYGIYCDILNNKEDKSGPMKSPLLLNNRLTLAETKCAKKYHRCILFMK